jgi:hypothetical protein
VRSRALQHPVARRTTVARVRRGFHQELLGANRKDEQVNRIKSNSARRILALMSDSIPRSSSTRRSTTRIGTLCVRPCAVI